MSKDPVETGIVKTKIKQGHQIPGIEIHECAKPGSEEHEDTKLKLVGDS